jgi:hypothetical protein
MPINPLRILKLRLSAAIDWRVRQEFERERIVLSGVAETVTDISVTYADQIAALNKSIAELETRLKALEK